LARRATARLNGPVGLLRRSDGAKSRENRFCPTGPLSFRDMNPTPVLLFVAFVLSLTREAGGSIWLGTCIGTGVALLLAASANNKDT
jgi:hypothetical protein